MKCAWRHDWSDWSGPWDIQPFSDNLFKIRRCRNCRRSQVKRFKDKGNGG